MDDIYQNGEPAPSRRGNRVLIAGGAVLILIAGFLILTYRHQLFPSSPTGIPGVNQGAPQTINTPEEKAKLLQSLQRSSSGGTEASSTTQAERARILQQVSAQSASSSASQPSEDEKAQLLQSLHQ